MGSFLYQLQAGVHERHISGFGEQFRAVVDLEIISLDLPGVVGHSRLPARNAASPEDFSSRLSAATQRSSHLRRIAEATIER